nr:hypothetical protein [Mucilaginibacter sp. L294]
MIDKNIALTNFYKRAQKDQRLLPSHLAVFTAICMLFEVNVAENAIKITRKKVMEIAKIRSKSTYHRCISDLAEFEYIVYQPSYDHYSGTYVFFPPNKY